MTITRVDPSMINTVVVDLATDVAAASTDLTTLRVVDEQAVAADLTIPTNVFLEFTATGKISPTTGKTVTIYSPENILAPKRQQVFGGAGSIAFTYTGIIYAEWWGAVADASTNNYTALQAALNTGSDLQLLGGEYRSADSLSYTLEGQIIKGIGRGLTTLRKTDRTDGEPVLKCAYNFAGLQDIKIGHQYEATPPATAGNDGFLFSETDGVADSGKGYGFMKNVHIRNCNIGITNDTGATESGCFSWQFDSVNIRQCAASFVYLNPSGSGSSGNLWNNLYCANARTDTYQMTGRAVDIREGSNTVFNQLNIEACIVDANEALYFSNKRNMIINGFHCEDVEVRPNTVAAGALIKTSNESIILNGVIINDLKVDVINTDDVTSVTHFAVIKAISAGTDQPQVVVNGLHLRNTDDITPTTEFNLFDDSDADLDPEEGFTVSLNAIKSEKDFNNLITDSPSALLRCDFQYVDNGGENRVTTGKLTINDGGELTISSGVVTATHSYHEIDTESDAASDDLDTINGGHDGMVLIIKAKNGARTVVVKHGTGNILCRNGADVTLDDVSDQLMLRMDDGDNWVAMSL